MTHEEYVRRVGPAIADDLQRAIRANEDRLREIIVRDLYRVPPKELRPLTWRERFAALNRFNWTEFRSGVGYRFVDDPKSRDLSGLASLLS